LLIIIKIFRLFITIKTAKLSSWYDQVDNNGR